MTKLFLYKASDAPIILILRKCRANAGLHQFIKEKKNNEQSQQLYKMPLVRKHGRVHMSPRFAAFKDHTRKNHGKQR
jgi:hypothetical protein